MNATIRNFRISKLTTAHSNANAVLTLTGQTLTQIAAILGKSVDDTEKKLSALVDEGLCSRTKGSRLTATYTGILATS